MSWNDDGAEQAILEQFDTVSFPPGVCRAFRNVGDEEDILQVIITGGVHDMNDIALYRAGEARDWISTRSARRQAARTRSG